MSEFQQYLIQQGYDNAPDFSQPGKFYRFRSSGAKAKNVFAKLFDDGEGGIYGDWKEGTTHIWQSRNMREMPAAEREALAAVHRIKADIARREREESFARNAERAESIYNKLPLAQDHPYLTAKGIKSHGVRVTGDGRLAILATSITDDGVKPATLQFIAADGDKRFLTGGKTGGAFFTLEGDNSTVYLCEGFATGASIHEATQCTVIVAFNAGNLMTVARAVRQHTPGNIIIAADDDYQTVRPPNHPQAGQTWNPGLEAANAAAQEINAKVIVPKFSGANRGTDFNDLALIEGASVVLKQLSTKTFLIDLDQWTYDAQGFEGIPQKREWLIRGVFPMGQAALLASAGGLGKSYLMLDLAHKVAIDKHTDFWNIHRKTAFGNIERGGTAFYISAEDDKIEIHSRLAEIDPARTIHKEGKGKQLITIPGPDMGMSPRLFTSDKDDVSPTPLWLDIVERLKAIENLTMVVLDPIQALIAADMNNPSHVQAISSELSRLAAETGASVIFTHHVKKPNSAHPIETPADARESIRGTGAVVDSVRAAVVLWETDSTTGRDICDVFNTEYEPGKVARLAVVKSNGEAMRDIKTLVRSPTGILVDRSDELKQAMGGVAGETESELIAAIQNAYLSGRGFSITNVNGVYHRREELPAAFLHETKRKLEAHILDLCANGKLEKDADGHLKQT